MGDVQGGEPRQLDERRRTPQVGIDFLKGVEGFSEEGEFITKDESDRNIVTIGHGNTTRSKEFLKGGPRKIDAGQAEDFLRKDVVVAEKDVKRLIDKDRLDSLTDNQYSAVVSLLFNVGSTNFEGTKAMKALNAGRMDEFIFEAFDTKNGFVKQGGKTVQGLVNRREFVRKLFEGGE